MNAPAGLPRVCGICDATLTLETGCAHFRPLGEDPERKLVEGYRRALAILAAAGGPGWEIADRALAGLDPEGRAT